MSATYNLLHIYNFAIHTEIIIDMTQQTFLGLNIRYSLLSTFYGVKFATIFEAVSRIPIIRIRSTNSIVERIQRSTKPYTRNRLRLVQLEVRSEIEILSEVLGKMNELRRKMEEIKDKTDQALQRADDFNVKKHEAKKILHEHLMQIECHRRHKQSLAHQLDVMKKRLKNKEKNVNKVLSLDADHVQVAEKAEARGEVHDMRIIENEMKVKELKKKIYEDHTLLEESKRKAHILKRDLRMTEARNKKHAIRIKEMEQLLEKNNSRMEGASCKRDDAEYREFEMEKMVDHMRDKIKLNEERIKSIEHVIPSLNYQIDVVNQEIKSVKEATQAIQDEMDETFDEDLFFACH